MCTYRLTFDDKLMNSVRHSFKSEKAMDEWIQSSMTMLLLQHLAKHNETTHKGRCKYSDEELEMMLADLPTLDESNIPSISDEDYKTIIKSMPKKPFKQVERWL